MRSASACLPTCRRTFAATRPADAIRPDTESGLEKWIELNQKYAEVWPNITSKREQLPDAETFDGEDNKLEKYFSDKPGQGD